MPIKARQLIEATEPASRENQVARQIAEFILSSKQIRDYVLAYENPNNHPQTVHDRYEKWLTAEITRILEP